LRDGAGDPLPHADLYLLQDTNNNNPPAHNTDANGRFTLTATPGTYRLRVYHGGGKHTTVSLTTAAFTLDADRTDDLTLPTHTVQVRVVGPSGNPVPGTKLRLSSYPVATGALAPGLTIADAGYHWGNATTDANGKATLQLLTTPTDPSRTTVDVEAPTGTGLANTTLDATNTTGPRTI
ncbi:carboxypeptidase-like regulatory domain-containing protein, partial [Nocardioides ferulae]|uniref:carboxypeptidase-like regulatory domain-containing protein n=1 Tax=Nocardioides ferulae TaxID=2340821 RepID=UPI0013DDAB40